MSDKLAVPPHVIVAYRMLKSAAAHGDDCPSNAVLVAAMGCESISSGARAVALLEASGMIEVKRFAQARVVTILETGESTRAVRGTPIRYLKGRQRTPELWPSQDLIEAFADELSQDGDVEAAGARLRVGRDGAYKLFARLKVDLGRQSA